MNTSRLAFLASLAALAAACSAHSSPPNDGAIAMDAARDTQSPDVAVETAVDAQPDASGYYVPAGYTLTPFLSAAPVTHFDHADMVLDATRHYQAVLETDAGRMVFDFYDSQTPITTNSFVFLARHHFFDGIAFHRVISGFVVQGGDPLTLDPNARPQWGRGDPGYQFGTEIAASLNFDSAGIVGMVRSSNPDSNGSQFFITLAPTPTLDGSYTVFARVVEGTDVPSSIAVGEPPANPTRMRRVYIVERPR